MPKVSIFSIESFEYLPGLILSQLFAQLRNSTEKKPFAAKMSLLWLETDPRVAIHYAVKTPWVEYLRLVMNEDDTSTTQKELNAGAGNWEHPDSVREFDSPKFMRLVEKLESWGYADEAEEFMNNVKQLIENTDTFNNNKRVVLFAHSMGNLFTLYFLNRQPQVVFHVHSK
uniref:Uncharacterized protein n=1 Tax=Romanomermis culicivorax TaxID=13658 RepID=A0A915JMM2_ROMCU